jgi:hypothetical protein
MANIPLCTESIVLSNITSATQIDIRQIVRIPRQISVMIAIYCGVATEYAFANDVNTKDPIHKRM